jgi:hypothetical protein
MGLACVLFEIIPLTAKGPGSTPGQFTRDLWWT